METKRKLTLASLAFTAVAGGSLLVASQTQAFERVGSTDFAQALATRFNLNVDEVKTFLDEQHAEHKQDMLIDMEARLNERLDQAVADGKITAEQKAAIVAKHDEVMSKMEALKDASQEERHEAMKTLHEELKTWAESQGFDMKWIGGMPMKMKFRHGFGPHGGQPSAEIE